jgi:acyl dehydratase
MDTSTYSLTTLSDWIGKELGTSQWVTIDQDRINEFARSTGDHQWIHVDVERAKKESPFGGPVAHGYLTLSLLADASMNIGAVPKDAVAAFNYGLDKVRFLAPVKAGARLRTHITLAEVKD